MAASEKTSVNKQNQGDLLNIVYNCYPFKTVPIKIRSFMLILYKPSWWDVATLVGLYKNILSLIKILIFHKKYIFCWKMFGIKMFCIGNL